MPVWKRASLVFIGGTVQMLQMVDRKVRTRVWMELPVTADTATRVDEKLEIQASTIARVGFVKATDNFFRIVVPQPKYVDCNLDKLTRLAAGSYMVVGVNWGTFRENFDVDC